MRSITLVFITILLIFTLSSRTVAQSSLLDSRVARLEADIFQLRNQINQLQAQSGRNNTRPNRPAPTTPRITNQRSSDPMFDRLATLVIELKERIQVLEAQVAQLRRR